MDKKIPWEIADLMVAKLNDSISQEESEQLEQWVNASKEHRLLYDRWLEGKDFLMFKAQCAEHDYSLQYHDFCQHVVSMRRRKWLRRWSVAAAVIMIPFVLSYWFYFQNETGQVVSQNDNILPGQFQALLTLPNGNTITLARNKGEIEVGNTTAIIQEDTLTYHIQEGVSADQFHMISIPRGGEYILKLSDGSRIWLNSETELRYPPVFTGKERKVFLKGEAYFEVAHDSLHPFMVETGVQMLTVLGTSFSIRAYTDEHAIVTTLEAGKVDIKAHDQQVILTPGYQSNLSDGHIEVARVNTSLYTAWHKGIFIFEDQPLKEILNTLSRWYNIEVFYASPELENIRFTGELLRYDQIQEFLEKIQVLEKVKFAIKGRTVIVSKY